MDEYVEHERSGFHRVWIFHGEAARFASGVFDDEATALAWVSRHALTES
jgi:hypothetical protein